MYYVENKSLLSQSYCKGKGEAFVWHLNYAIRGSQKNKLPSMLLNSLRWFQAFPSTLQECIFMDHDSHFTSVDAQIMKSKHCPVIDEHVAVICAT